MSDIKPNSHKFKAEQEAKNKRVEKIIDGGVTKTKKSGISNLASTFISEDAANVKSYIFMDVLVPAIKKAISDIVRDGIDMILYGGTSNNDRKPIGSNVPYVSYSNYSNQNRVVSNNRADTRFDYDNLKFENRGQVEAVREQMEEVINTYGFVTVADMYEMVGFTAPFTANKYGWTSIRTAEPVRVRDGYILKLPKATPID